MQVADREVVALGTVFSVRLTPSIEAGSDALDVTLNEGQVSVRAGSGASDKTAETRSVLLKPGDRLRLSDPGDRAAAGARRVTMEMDTWRRSEAVFDDVLLFDAVAEMNRYSRQPIVLVGDDSLRGMRIRELFRTGDNVDFARAWLPCTGLSGMTIRIVWSLRRVVEVEEIGE